MIKWDRNRIDMILWSLKIYKQIGNKIKSYQI